MGQLFEQKGINFAIIASTPIGLSCLGIIQVLMVLVWISNKVYDSKISTQWTTW
jgi:hypothetical protein